MSPSKGGNDVNKIKREGAGLWGVQGSVIIISCNE